MNYQKYLVSFLVIVALLGYVFSSIYLFIDAMEIIGLKGENIDHLNNSAREYVNSALTGLVGGIVAVAFGVKVKIDAASSNLRVATSEANTPKSKVISLRNINLQNLGSVIAPSTINAIPLTQQSASNTDDTSITKSKGILGFLYALSYILIGIVATFIWTTGEGFAPKAISHMSTTFLGMMIPIVAGFFSNKQE